MALQYYYMALHYKHPTLWTLETTLKSKSNYLALQYYYMVLYYKQLPGTPLILRVMLYKL